MEHIITKDVDEKLVQFAETQDANSPYCKSCGGCGEEGCCSPIRCMYQAMIVNKNPKCDYAENYFNDIKLGYLMGEKLFNLIAKKGSDELKKMAGELYDKLWDEIHRKV